MAFGQWGDSPDNPYRDYYDPNDGGGSPGGGTGVHIDPKTGKIDPNYHPPVGNPGGGGGGLGAPGGGSGGAAGSGNGVATPADWAAWTSTGGTTTGVGGGIGSTMVNAASGLLSSVKWGDILNAALAIYGLHEAQKPPKIYPVPPSPSEQYRLDKTKGLYDFTSGYTDQYMKGLSNLNPDFQMPNNLTGNPAFMGGVKVPTIDFGKVPPMNAGANATTNPASSIPPGITPDRVKVDSAGKWTIDNPTPEEQAWLDAANRARLNKLDPGSTA